MSHVTTILGKAGTGRTLVAAHTAMALGDIGERTLLVGAGATADTQPAVTGERRPTLVEALQRVGVVHDELTLREVVAPASDYVDTLELGAAPLLVGDYASVVEHGLHTLDLHRAWDDYDHVIFDLADDRFDATLTPLLRRTDSVLAVTTEAPAALFVLNRLLRAVLIGSYEMELSVRLLGVVNNRSVHPAAFERYVAQSRLPPLHTVPEDEALARLRATGLTVFGAPRLPDALRPVLNGFVDIADLIRAGPLHITPTSPLEDGEVWRLANLQADG